MFNRTPDPIIKNLSVVRKSYIPGLYYKNSNDLWRNANQQSTWELCIYIRRALTDNTSSQSSEEDHQWVQYIYNIVRTHPNKYGYLAGNDDWCHHFTDEQLTNFYDLVEKTD